MRPNPGRTHVLSLALIQGNIPQTLKFDATQKPMIFERYRTLTATVVTNGVDLIVWPETATPDALRYDLETFTLATNIAGTTSAYLLTGTIDADAHVEPVRQYNAAILVRPDGTLGGAYRKMHLVPFGEYVPLRKVFPFLKWLTPIPDSLEPGSDPALLNVKGYNFGVVICFEDTVPDVYRQFTRQAPDFMINLTNDAWFQRTPAGRLHLANAVFRCAEARRPLVRSTNHGVTCLVNEFGAVVSQVPEFTAGAAVLPVPFRRDQPPTYYSTHGDVFVLGCAVVAGLVSLQRLLRRENREICLPSQRDSA
jgi:apolipoprotein N-acyltransferase